LINEWDCNQLLGGRKKAHLIRERNQKKMLTRGAIHGWRKTDVASKVVRRAFVKQGRTT